MGAKAQTLKGRVTDANDATAIYPVTVVNLRTQQSTNTNLQGYYTIQARAGDKIAFSYVGYKSKQYIMPISSGIYNADIQLEMVSYWLQEVTLMPDYTEYQLDSIERVKTYRLFLNRQKSSPIGSPFSFVAEKLNRRSKQIFKFKKNFNKWEVQKFIDSRYTPELVTEMTHMTGDSLAHFMNATPMPYDYARTATELEMKMWIRFHHKEWLKEVQKTGLPKINDSLITAPNDSWLAD